MRKLKEKKETLALYRRLALPLQKYEVCPNLCNKPEFPFYCAIQMQIENDYRTLMTFDAKKEEKEEKEIQIKPVDGINTHILQRRDELCLTGGYD